jgi:hypothetical protein
MVRDHLIVSEGAYRIGAIVSDEIHPSSAPVNYPTHWVGLVGRVLSIFPSLLCASSGSPFFRTVAQCASSRDWSREFAR